MDIVTFKDDMQKQLESFFETCFSAVGIPYSPTDRHADIANIEHYRKMCLDTRKQFSAAQYLYRSVGFRLAERYNANEHAELYFELDL